MEMLLSRWRANILLAVVSLLLLTPVIQAIGVVEYPLPTPGNNALELVLGPDGNFWFADAAGNEIGHITPQGVVREFPLPLAKSLPEQRLVVGADGNLWFTEIAPARIARISPAGVIREFMLPDPNRIARLLQSGPDGNL
jgi:virginiamycin B lyase